MTRILTSLQKKFTQGYARFHPTSATALGIKGYDGVFLDYSPSSYQSYLSEISILAHSLRLIKPPLGSSDWIDCRLLKNKIKLEKKEWEFQSHLKDPSLYVSEVLYGLWYLWVRPFSRQERFEAMMGRLAKIPDFLDQARSLLQFPVKVWLCMAQEEIVGLKSFLQDCEKELLRTYPREKPSIQKVIGRALKASKDFETFLKKNISKKASPSFAVGAAHFDFLLKTYHGYSQGHEEILKIGQKVFQEVQEELKETAAKIRKGASWESLIDAIKKEHPSQRNLMASYQKASRALKKFLLKSRLVQIPKGEKLRIIPTPLFARNTVPYAAYIDPPLFGKDLTGHFFVTPVPNTKGARAQEYLKEHSEASIIITSLHEGYPGHHLQFVWQALSTSPLRKLFNCSSYYEGWALYCEQMMGEVGYYDNKAKLLQLKDKLWRACRVIVDVGMHTQGLGDEEAVDFLSRNARMSKAAARADVNWYTQRPSVPQSYLTGMLQIKSLRHEAQRAWGKRYSLSRFHHWFLQYGAIPVPFIRKALKREGE